jgi:hypothetical protein
MIARDRGELSLTSRGGRIAQVVNRDGRRRVVAGLGRDATDLAHLDRPHLRRGLEHAIRPDARLALVDHVANALPQLTQQNGASWSIMERLLLAAKA